MNAIHNFDFLKSKHLEAILVSIVRGTENAEGAILLVFHPNKRIEVVAALPEGMDDLPGKLQALADQVKDGDGYPIGSHSKLFTGGDTA